MLHLDGYKNIERIHQSKQNAVFRGERGSDGQKVVIKTTIADTLKKGGADLERDYEITSKLSQAIPECVMQTLEKKQQEGRMALCFVDDAAQSLVSLIPAEGMSVPTFLKFAISCCELLSKIHKQLLVHRDVKPNNFIVNESKNLVKIIDFGISSFVSLKQPSLPPSASLEGTLQYIAPEQTGRTQQVCDYRADLYSLGATLFQMLTGRHPFESTDPVELVYSHIAKVPILTNTIRPDTPAQIAFIIEKLLKKNPEERYQSATGVKRDLERCLQELQEKNQISEFTLAQHDEISRFKVSQKLYGRESEISALQAELNKTIQAKRPSVVLIRGYSGCGKSALVQELKKREHSLLFIEGKFDQLKKGIPYSAFVDAVKSIVHQLLVLQDEELDTLKKNLNIALEGNGQAIVDLCSEATLLLGPQPVLSAIDSNEAQARLNACVVKFLSCITEIKPIVLFLDDLQWSDTPSLKLLDVFSQASNIPLMIIGAYRDNEVDSTHPLMIVIEEINSKKSQVQYIDVKPLQFTDLNQFVADTLCIGEASAQELTTMIQQKTEGNPFFTKEFLLTLYQEQLITYAEDEKKWKWNAELIGQMKSSDNVVDFMVRNLKKLPERQQKVLHYASCVGSTFSLTNLGHALEENPEGVIPDILELVKDGWIGDFKSREKKVYGFLHDRIQAGAYMLYEEESRKQTHLKIGLNLAAQCSMENLQGESILFDITNHLNHAKDLLQGEQKQMLLKLNIESAIKARESSAFDPWLTYAKNAVSLLNPETCWSEDYQNAFNSYFLLAQANQICTHLEEAKEYFTILKNKANNRSDKVNVHTQLTRMLYNMGQYQNSVEAAMEGICLFEELNPPKTATDDQQLIGWAMQTKASIDEALKGKDLDYILNLSFTTEKEYEHLLHLSLELCPVLFAYDGASKMTLPFLASLCLKVTLDHGLCNYTAAGVGLYAWCVGMIFNEYQKGYQYCLLSIDLTNKVNARDPLPKVISLIAGGLCGPWGCSAKKCKDYDNEALLIALQAGLKTWAGTGTTHLGMHLLQTNTIVTKSLEIINNIFTILDNGKVVALSQVFKYSYGLMLQWYKGNTLSIDTFATPDIGEEDIEHSVSTTIAHNKAIHYCFKAFAMYLGGYHEKAKQYIDQAELNIMGIFGLPIFYHFPWISGIVNILVAENAENQEEFNTRIAKVEGCLEKLAAFSALNPTLFHAWYMILKAEYMNICNTKKGEKNDKLEILQYYDNAVVAAQKNEMTQYAGLASELAAKFCIQSKLNDKITATYLTDAVNYWDSYGATRKVKLLEERYHKYLQQRPVATDTSSTISSSTFSGATSTNLITSTSSGLDTLTIIKASQALSGEIEVDSLLSRFMKIVMENAGAERGCILLQVGSSLSVQIETDAKGVSKKINQDVTKYERIALSVIKTVSKTAKPIILENASQSSDFKQDSYVLSNNIKSMLCAPIKNKGLLYLENNTIEGAFIPARLQVVNILLSQIAISVENAHLYSDMKELNQAYARFLPREFLRELEKGDVKDIALSDCLQKNTTVLFSDIRNFTTISESMTPEENFKWLNEYLNAVGPIIRQHNGFIDKFIGDAIMALFPHNPMDAIMASQAMLEKLDSFNAEMKGKYPTINIGVGLNSGKVMLGTIGESERMEGTVIGDVVNSASRFESLTKTFGTDVICSQSTLDALVELKQKQDPSVKNIDYRLIGLFKVKGKVQDLPLYEIYSTSRKDKEAIQTFTRGLALFIQKNFTEAMKVFSSIAQKDLVAEYYIPLCESLGSAKEYLPKEWKGEVELDKGGAAQTDSFNKMKTKDLESKVQQLEAQVKAFEEFKKKLLEPQKPKEEQPPSRATSAPPQTFARSDSPAPPSKKQTKSGVCIVQ